MSWLDIGDINEIAIRGARIVKTPAGCIGLFRTDETSVYAISNTCPHKNGPLNEGIVHGTQVTCPLHNMVFDLQTGQAQGEDHSVATYPVKVEGSRILLDLASLSQRSAA